MFIKDFTDPQGVAHIGAVFEVCDTSLNISSNDKYRLDLGEVDTPSISFHSNNNLRYRIYYWTDQESRDAGNLPYVLANLDPLGEWFTVRDLTKEYIGNLSVHDLTEKHCKEFILV